MNPSILLDALVISTIASSALLLLALLIVRLRHGWSGALRHQVLAAAVLAGLVFVPANVALTPGPTGCLLVSCGSSDQVAAEVAGTQLRHSGAAALKFDDLPPGGGRPAQRGTTSSPWVLLVLGLWSLGVLAAVVRLAVQVRRAGGIRRDAEPTEHPTVLDGLRSSMARLGVRREVACLEHPDLAVPVVVGVWRPAVVVPRYGPTRSDPSRRGPAQAEEMVLLHELAHIKRRDPLVSFLSELVRAVYWFNPLVSRALRRLREMQELAADSAVIHGGVRRSDYAGFLLAAFRELTGRPVVPAGHMHSILGDCLMDTRLRTVLDAESSGRATRGSRAAVMAATLALVSALLAGPELLQARGVLAQETVGGQRLDTSLLNAAALDSLLRPVFIDHMADRYIAGSAISVVHGGEIVYEQGFGRREVFYERPVEAETTIWRIGSISKVVTGLAVMQLVDRGLLDLEADVNDYLTEFQIPDTFDEPVRVRHLLTHTAGFDQIGLGRHERRAEDVRPLGEFLAEYLSRIRPPDEVSTYDTYAITLAGYLVEQVSGLSFEEYLQQHIFAPLDMHRSGIAVPPALVDDVAIGYGFAGSWEAQRWEYMNTDPASTVNATVGDMANLARMFLSGGTFDGTRVLSEASTDAMLSRQWRNHPDQPGYGLTFWEDQSFGVEAYSHGGSMQGYGSVFLLVPEHELGIFIAANQESASIFQRVLSRLMPALFPGSDAAPPQRERLADFDATRFAGTYANSLYHHADPENGWRRRPFELEVDAENRLLFDGAPAWPVGPLDFQREDGLLISFREDDRGEIEYMFVNQTVYERLP